MRAATAFAIFMFSAVVFVSNAAGCLPAWSAADLIARKIQCALANRDLPDAELFAKCAIDPKDAKDIMDIIGKERAHDAALRNAGCR
jgi:hypothetical protein